MSSKIEFTDVSMFDFEIDNFISKKIKKQKEEILKFFETQKGVNSIKQPITISASIEENKVVFTLMQEIPIV
jgi:hypothetical protein